MTQAIKSLPYQWVEGYWQACSVKGPECTKTQTAGADRLDPATGLPICAKCAKASGVQRTHEAKATDKHLTGKPGSGPKVSEATELAEAKAGTHKSLFTKAGAEGAKVSRQRATDLRVTYVNPQAVTGKRLTLAELRALPKVAEAKGAKVAEAKVAEAKVAQTRSRRQAAKAV